MFVPIRILKRNYSIYTANELLTPENRQRTIEKFNSITFRSAQQSTLPTKKAAVLIPLCIVDNQVALLYTLRAAHLKTHRSQVSFPGGMIDVTDKSVEHTALRETHEELGIKNEHIDIWGEGNWINSRGLIAVLPIIGQITPVLNINKLQLNPSEVEEVFTVPIKDLCDPKHRGHTQFRGGHVLPIFFGGKIKIWGLTALITNWFLSALIPNNSYNPQIKSIPPVMKFSSK